MPSPISPNSDVLEQRIARLEALLDAVRLSTFGLLEFAYQGRTYRYASRSGNRTFDNERAVELPVVAEAISGHGAPGDTIEIGNVLRHYYRVGHTVVDKYERHPDVLNEDVLTYRPERAVGLVVSISTLEHVGHSEEDKQPEKFRLAVDNTTTWLRPGGRLLFTVPLGYNPSVDAWLERPPAGFVVHFMRRRTLDNQWEEVPWSFVRGAEYGRPYPCANAVAFVSFTRDA